MKILCTYTGAFIFLGDTEKLTFPVFKQIQLQPDTLFPIPEERSKFRFHKKHSITTQICDSQIYKFAIAKDSFPTKTGPLRQGLHNTTVSSTHPIFNFCKGKYNSKKHNKKSYENMFFYKVNNNQLNTNKIQIIIFLLRLSIEIFIYTIYRIISKRNLLK